MTLQSDGQAAVRAMDEDGMMKRPPAAHIPGFSLCSGRRREQISDLKPSAGLFVLTQQRGLFSLLNSIVRPFIFLLLSSTGILLNQTLLA